MKIVVPLDFTPVTENALKYAIGLTDVLAVKNITLFHVIDNEKDRTDATEKLKNLQEKYRSNTSATLQTFIKPGNIFDEIGSTAAALEASLIVMGTHGIHGMQRVLGSRAMKVITHSQTPYIVVQQLPYKPVKKILIPIDFTKEVKQLLPMLETLNAKFNATFCLITQAAKDEFIQNKIDNNLQYFKSYMNDNNISFIQSGTYSSSKYKEVIQHAKDNQADMLVTTIDPDVNITDFIMGVDEQKLIANELQLPVLCVNVKHYMSRNGNVFEYTF